MVTFGSRTTQRKVGKNTNVDNGIDNEPLTFFGNVTGADHPSTGDKLSKRGPMRRWSMIGAALTVIVVVTFVVIGGSGPGSRDAAAQVMLGARTTLDKNTVKMTISGSFSSGGQTIPITGSGSADLSSDTESVTMSFDANYTAIAETFVAHGSSTYEQIMENSHNLISRVLPGKQWIQGPNRGTSAGGLGLETSNILGQLQIFAQQGNSVVAIGPSTINGESVAGYQVTLSQKSMNAAYKRVEDQSRATAAAVKAYLQSVSFNDTVIKLWISKSHLLVSEDVDISLSTGGTAVSGDLTMDFSNYGSPVSITVPPPSDVSSVSKFEAATNHSQNGY
jgi:hypothetical protein